MSSAVVSLLSSRMLYVSMARTPDGIPWVAVRSDTALRVLALQKVDCGLLDWSGGPPGIDKWYGQHVSAAVLDTDVYCT